MLSDMGNSWQKSNSEDKRAFVQTLFTEIVFDLDTHRITGFALKPWAEQFLQARPVYDDPAACLEGFKEITAPLPTTKEAMYTILRVIYGDNPPKLQTWEKLQRNAEIFRRYEAGEDSVVLGHAFGRGDRRIRDIIARE